MSNVFLKCNNAFMKTKFHNFQTIILKCEFIGNRYCVPEVSVAG